MPAISRMGRNRSVDVHQFAMIPRAEIPRSAFNRQTAHKTTFNGGDLIPFYVDEVLPGDSFRVRCSLFARMATPVFPLMDNLHLDTFFFFVPNRLLWTNWKKFMGEQDNPGDSISFTVPVLASGPTGGFAVGSIFDYMGLPTVGQFGAGNNPQGIAALHLRAYNLIWNEWFRDENLQNSVAKNVGDGPDALADYALLKRGKRKDYFTSALPWPQKGSTAVSLPLGTSAPVVASNPAVNTHFVVDGTQRTLQAIAGTAQAGFSGANAISGSMVFGDQTGLMTDLSTATAATINQLRQAFQIQKLLERDARGGTRYTEIVRSHFGVVSPDARLQRPEYLGGGTSPVLTTPVPQTSISGATPLGTLAGVTTISAGGHGFSQSFTEHGVIIGLVMVRADLTYQQGLRKMWKRSTRYDFYFPAFAMLGEQAVQVDEIFYDGNNSGVVFGYQERWAEYRYMPAMITGKFKSTSAGTIDPWHLAQKFASVPTLNDTFIKDDTYNSVKRAVAAGSAADGMQFIFDSFIDIKCVRPMPMYSVPGMIDHF